MDSPIVWVICAHSMGASRTSAPIVWATRSHTMGDYCPESAHSIGHSRNYHPYYGRASPIVWATTSTNATYSMGDKIDPTHTMGELCQNSPIVWPKTPIVWVDIAYTMAEKFTPTMSKVPLLWARFTSTMAQSTSTMAQYHLYYGPIDPYYGSIGPYYG